ncbi:hypothetical protein TNCV_1514761 [Trichonephila clavipes]|nr:hypothetical protein TNCV_1514761 [Trichonephila clavipes]
MASGHSLPQINLSAQGGTQGFPTTGIEQFPIIECMLWHSAISSVLRIWNRFLETGSAGRRPGQGRRRATTPNEDRYLVLMA